MAVGFESWASLIETAAAVSGMGDLDDVVRFAARAARELTGARYAALGVIGEHGMLIDFVHEGMTDDDAARIGHLPEGRGVLGTIIRDKKTVRLEDVTTHPDSAGFPPNHPSMTSFLGVPVRVGDTAFGNLYLTDKPGGFTEQDEEAVEALAVIVGAAVVNARTAERLRRLAIVEDRERIARDVHDAIIQDLFAVGLQLQGAGLRTEDPVVRTAIEEAVERLDEAITGLRRFIFGLRQVTVGSPLAARLDEAVNDLVAGRPLSTSITVAPPNLALEDSLADHVVQVVREATSNAARHAQANHLEVSVIQSDSTLAIAVVDDGLGFDPANAPAGMGLENLRKRVHELGGSMHIDSSVGRGTAVRVSLALIG